MEAHMSEMNIAQQLKALGACADAIVWTKRQEGTAQSIWSRCRRADWMLWIAARAGICEQSTQGSESDRVGQRVGWCRRHS
jgi:hypothetical protein